MILGITDRYSEGSSTNLFPWRSESLGKDGSGDQREGRPGDRDQKNGRQLGEERWTPVLQECTDRV